MLNSAVITFIAVLVVFVCFGCLFLEQLTRTACELPQVADQAIAREGTLTLQLADKQITALSGRLNHQVKALRGDLFTRVDTVQAQTFQESWITSGPKPTRRSRIPGML